ncbi:MAG: discoidin domain-containing protein [Bacteroidales bacterium]|nr:discoidin domain-containing protein [Bacteroidales bacterium]
MKKFSYFLSLLLFFVAGVANVQAQYYEPGSELDNMDQIVGKKVFVKTNTQETDTYMCGTKGTTTVSDDCLMMFEEVEGLKVDGYQCYRLKQVSTGKYIKDHQLLPGEDTSDNHPDDADPYVALTANPSEAFAFTALAYEADSEDLRKMATEDKGNQSLVNGGFIFTRAALCSDGSPTYLGYWGSVFMSPYTDTNTWTIWEADEITNLAQVLSGFLDFYFPNGVSESEFPYGINPGQYNQEAYNNAYKVYEDAFDASTDAAGLTKEIVQEWANKLAAAKAALVVNPLVAGYYYISDSRSPVFYLYNDNAEAAKAKFLLCDETTPPNKVPNIVDAKYIWHITAGEEAGQWFFENFKTGKRACNTTEEKGVTAFTVNSDGNAFKVEAAPSGAAFIIMRATDDAQWNTAVNQGKYICSYNAKNDPGNKFQFYTLDAESVAALAEAVKQDALNKELEALYNTANGTYAGSRKFSGAPEGESFGDAADNLVTDAAVLESNAVATNEGALANLLDGDYTTYFHTAWQAADGPDPATWHYVQADLGEPVSALALKYARRSQNPNGCNPTLIQVLSTNDLASEEWTDNGTFTMTYTIDATIGGNVSQNFIGTCGFELAEPARYVRLLVKDRINGTSSELLAGYPFWYLSELHFFKGEYDPETSPFELVPVKVREALAEQLANAKDELSTSEATQETLDTLKAAYEAFLSLLPDTKRVTDAIAAAQAYHDAAPSAAESKPGYFPEEAKTAFQAAIDAVEVGGNMNLQQINDAIAALEAATATFKASLYLPTVGSYYLIRSMSETYNQAMVYANTTATTGGIRFRSQVAESEAEDAAKIDAVDWKDHPNYVWYVEAAANGKVTLRNVLTGRYFALQDTKNNGVQQSTTPVEVPVQSALIDGGVNFVVGEGLYANTAGGGLLVAWDSANGADNSSFGFEEVTSDNLNVDGEFMWGVQSGAPQIITLPVAVSGVNSGKAYKFLGENAEHEFVFEEIDGVEAGVPFLFVADADLANNEASFNLEGNSSFTNATEYATVAQDQNGMQGTFEDITVSDGCGVYYGGQFYILRNAVAYLRNVGANSGYFNGKQPKGVTAVGDYKFKVYGTVDSINQIVAGDSEAPVNVYNLSGVLVRQNVKAGQATNGLAKGLYIVNGKKLFVK